MFRVNCKKGRLMKHALPEFSLLPTIVWQASLHDSGFCQIQRNEKSTVNSQLICPRGQKQFPFPKKTDKSFLHVKIPTQLIVDSRTRKTVDGLVRNWANWTLPTFFRYRFSVFVLSFRSSFPSRICKFIIPNLWVNPVAAHNVHSQLVANISERVASGQRS